MLRIGIDVDDVLNNLVDYTLSVFAQRTWKEYTPEIFTQFDVSACLPPEEAKQFLSIFGEEDTWRNLVPNADAQDTVEALCADGHSVYFVSACSPHTCGWKSEWLRKFYPTVPERNHVFIYNKALLALDILVDDNPQNLRGGIYRRVLYSKPWNASTSIAKYDDKISVLSEVLPIVRREENAIL